MIRKLPSCNRSSPPAALIAPYFYVEASASKGWIELNRRLAAASTKIDLGVPVHALVCAHIDLLTNSSQATEIIEG